MKLPFTNRIRFSPAYWKTHKPSVLASRSISVEEWENFSRILERYKQRYNAHASLTRIDTFFRQNERIDLNKKIGAFLANGITVTSLKEHCNHVSYLYDQEKKRQESLDNKARQIVTYVSLLFSAIAFSSVVILNKDNYVVTYTEFSIFCVVPGLLLAIYSLVIAVLCLNVRKYSRPVQGIVFDPGLWDEERFLKQRIIDFFGCLDHNEDVNTKKSNRIAGANRSFLGALFLIALFTFINISAIGKRNGSSNQLPQNATEFTDTIPVQLQKDTIITLRLTDKKKKEDQHLKIVFLPE